MFFFGLGIDSTFNVFYTLMVYHELEKCNMKSKKLGRNNPDWKPTNGVAYARTPVQLKVLPGVRERLMSISGWQEKVRVYIDSLIVEGGEGG
jgi:hypothetical protein